MACSARPGRPAGSRARRRFPGMVRRRTELVRADLCRGYHPGALGPRRRNHRQLEAGRGGPGHRCRFVDDGRSASGRRSRGGGRRPDVCRRSVPGELRGATGNPQPDGLSWPAYRAPRSSISMEASRRSRSPRSCRAPPAGSARRCRRGRRNDRERHRNPGSFRPDRRVRARQAGRGRARHERGHQCRRCLLPARDETGGREHLRRHRATRRGGQELEGADGQARRPVRHRLPDHHGLAGRRRLAVDGDPVRGWRFWSWRPRVL